MISFLLPYPPSWNHLYRISRSRMFKSSHYTNWTKEAHRFLEEQNVQADTFTCPVTVIAEVGRKNSRKVDLDNIFKSVGDFLEDAEILENDHLIHRWDIYWSNDIQNGVQVTIRPMGAD